MCFNGCNNPNKEEQVNTTTEQSTTINFIVKGGTISNEYSELFHTWYSGYDVIAFTDDGEFYLTYDDIGYCISGNYTIEDDIINVVIDQSTIRNNLMTVSDTSYKFKFIDGNLVLTLVEDESQTVTYYLDKSVALGESN